MKQFITWDLGATKCRAGIIACEKNQYHCDKQFTVKLSDAKTLHDLIKQIEHGLGLSHQKADAICIAAAGQYDDGIIHLEKNYPFPMDFRELPTQLKWPQFSVIHDYDAIICATFTSYMNIQNVRMLNEGVAKPYARRTAIGVGTGLGVKDGVQFQDGKFWLGKNEMGHIGITVPPVSNAPELEVMRLVEFLTKNNSEPLTFEKILSGRGLVNLHQFYYPNTPTHTPESVGDAMKNNQAEKVVAAFAWFLGLFVGSLQITFLPEGGVWLTGGVLLHHLNIVEHPLFRVGINATPAFLKKRETYPLGVLLNETHALIGAGYYAAHRMVK